MNGQCVTVFTFVTLFLLFSTVRCRPIYPLSSEFSKNGQDTGTNAGRTSDSGNVKTDQTTTSTKNVDSVKMANPPEGTGIFRDPIEVLGPKFPDSVVVDLCKVNLFVFADIISDIVFLDKGMYLCDQVCRQYQKTMEFDGPVDVSLMKGYCDYTGITDFAGVSEKDDNRVDLSTECTCAYKIRCDQRTNVIMYTFQANSDGFLKVSSTEPNQKHHIT